MTPTPSCTSTLSHTDTSTKLPEAHEPATHVRCSPLCVTALTTWTKVRRVLGLQPLRVFRLAAGGAPCLPPMGSATRSNGRCALPHPSAPQGAWRCAASAAPLCAQHGLAAPPRRAGAAVPLAAAAGPGSLHAARPGSAAPDCPEAAPCAGGAWTAGALVRVSGRHCAGRGKAPARAWRELEVGAWCALSECATRLEAPCGSGAQGRERRAALSSVALSPRGVARCRASSKTRSPSAAVNAALACVSARPAARPRQLAGLPAPALPGCQPIAEESEGRCPSQPRAPQSLAGRRGWGGVRTPLRRGPRQARCAGLPRVAG